MQSVDDSIPRAYPTTPLMGVGAIITDGSRVILVKRGKEPSLGEWSIPGGLVRVGETLHAAVAREALEETGLTVVPEDLVELLERILHDDRGRVQYHYVLADYRCKVIDGRPIAGSDAVDAQWFERDRLTQLGLAPVTLRVILKALDGRHAPFISEQGGDHNVD
jgi:8-oxo-dGTP diphosphatase